MLHHAEALLDPTAQRPEVPPSTGGLLAFYWHYLRQIRSLLVPMFLFGGLTAIFDASIPFLVGRVVGLLSSHTPDTLLRDVWPQLTVMAVVLGLLRPTAFLCQVVTINQIVNPGFANMIRWQSHWHVVRQSWAFFQNDFAGRIANRVIQTGQSLRESVVMSFDAGWYILVYGSSTIILLTSANWRLTLPMLIWFVAYGRLLWYFLPRLHQRSRAVSQMRSNLSGRVVDSYTNILTVKLFSRTYDEDTFVREALDKHTTAYRSQTRLITKYVASLTAMNVFLNIITACLAIWLWTVGRITLGETAMVIPLTWQIATISATVARNFTGIFENIGTVQDGMKSIAAKQEMADPPDAKELRVTTGEICFENLHFNYGREQKDESGGVLQGINLHIKAGERVGLVGHSGAGKSTLVNLLMHFFDAKQGRILIDGQDISCVTQESLRSQIAMVTQDTALLHRSIGDNIRYGTPRATQTMIEEAAQRAKAHDFILSLEDWSGRTGYDAHVGDRGVKLSGGQRQRIALARVILKDAPILILDEATSALDSEVEMAIQGQLETLMEGRTVIAIAHRLSTIARLDRLIVLDHGRIVESGTHAELIAQNRIYAGLWHCQSGGFIHDQRSLDEKTSANASMSSANIS